MKTTITTLAIVVLGALAVPLLAQDGGGPAVDPDCEGSGPCTEAGAAPARGLRFRHADADGSGDVTAAEWDAAFRAADEDGDGVLVGAELGGRPAAGARGRHTQRGHGQRGHGQRGHGGPPSAAAVLGRLADADRDRAVSAQEWATFVAGIETDAEGYVVLKRERRGPGEGRGKGGGQGHGQRRGKGRGQRGARSGPLDGSAAPHHPLDVDADGHVTAAEVQTRFAEADADGDGALSSTELGTRAGGPRGRRGKRGKRGKRGGRGDSDGARGTDSDTDSE